MFTTKESVISYLKQMNTDFKVIDHPAVNTIEEMEQANVPYPEYIVKNLFLRDDKKRQYYLVVLQKDKRVDLKELKIKINSRPLSFASEEDLYFYLKLKKGSVSPLGILNDINRAVKLIVDKDVKEFPCIGIHPNENTATLFLKNADFFSILESTHHEIVICTL